MGNTRRRGWFSLRATDPACGMTFQPRIADATRRWLEAIRAAHKVNTWADAAAIVLGEIATDPANPVNHHAFRAGDFPPPALGYKGRYGVLWADRAICIEAPAATAHHVAALTRGAGFASHSAAAAAVLRIARLSDDGRRYRPALVEGAAT